LQWVKEWWDKAKERNTKDVTTYRKAYNSLKACPLTFNHPSELKSLSGFGDKMCQRLTKLMEQHCEENGLPMPKAISKNKRKSSGVDEDEDASVQTKKPRKNKQYVPALRSGGYAIILALATLDENHAGGYTKDQVCSLAQPYCDSSFTAPANEGSFYTAWNSIKTLKSNGLVYEKGRPARYSLSDDGWDLARRFQKSSNPDQGRNDNFVAAERPNAGSSNDDSFSELDSGARKPSGESQNQPYVSDIVPQGKPITSVAALPTFEPIILEPGSFTIELVLDIREIRNRTDRDFMENNMSPKGVKPLMRALALGDMTWVAKVHSPNLLSSLGAEGDEVLLDYIVERKRLDDLVASIKDGRFTEQKFRLQKSGVKNVIYIIEEYNGDFGNYELNIQTAMASLQVNHGYFLKKTQNIDASIKYLVSMTKLLKERYETKPLYLIPTKVITTGNYLPLIAHLAKTQPTTDYHITYDAFASISSKSGSLTLRDVYIRMLMCTRGLTGEKAVEMQKRWETPKALITALQEVEGRAGGGEPGKKWKAEMVVNEMGALVARKKIQKAVSAKIAEVWGE
jgi:crossover junction endonuclease MUS81